MARDSQGRLLSAVLLVSGGLDSTALAAWKRPAHCLFIDYGQRATGAERRASSRVCGHLGLALTALSIDCSVLGRGSLAGQSRSLGSVWDEFWPFRNQMLLTFAAAWAIEHSHTEVWTGSIRSDDRHADGTSAFYRQASALFEMQEGAIRVAAPAIGLTSHDLITISGVADDVLSQTYSCHTGAVPCNRCSGCEKRAGALKVLNRLQPSQTV